MSARRSGFAFKLDMGALVLLVMGGAGWVAFSGVLGPERLEAELKRAALRATGRVLTIGGPVRIALGLAPSLIVENVALANVPGGSRPQMLAASRVTAQLALLPLLQGELLFEAITVENPDILLERAADGTPNWVFVLAKRTLFQPAVDNGASSGEPAGETEIHDIRINGGRLTWRSVSGASTTAAIDTGHFVAHNATSPIAISLHGDVQDVGFNLKLASGSLERLRGGPTTALAGAWPLTLDLNGDWGTLHVEGGFTHPDQLRAYDFRATANVPDLSVLRPAFPGLFLPPLHEVNFTTRLTDGTSGDLRTENLSLHAGVSDLGSIAPGLSIKEATISAPGPGQLVQISAEGAFQGTAMRLAGTATQPDVLALSEPVPAAFTAQVASASLSVRGTLPPALGMNGLDLTVSSRVPDLAELSPLAGRPLPAAKDLAFDAKIGDAGYKLRGITVRDIVFNSSLGDLAGNLTVAWAPIIDVRGALTSKTLDLDGWQLSSTIIAPPSALPAPLAAAPAGEPAPLIGNVQLPVAALRGADADLSLSINTIVMGGETLRDFQARLQASDGKLALNPFRFTAPAGLVDGGASMDTSTDNPPVAINLRSPAISAAALAAAVGAPGAVSGPLQIDAALSGVGASTNALLSTLTGHLGLSMVNGQVSDAFLASLLGNALGAAGLPGAGGDTSQVRCFATRADFNNGQGSFRALALDTSRLSLVGEGRFDLRDETLDLHLRPRLLLGGTEAAAPVSVKGRFAAPAVALDPIAGGRVGITLGGPPPASGCASALHVARGGMAGSIPAAAAPPDASVATKVKKPVDLLRGLFHH
jgi:AsmA protein